MGRTTNSVRRRKLNASIALMRNRAQQEKRHDRRRRSNPFAQKTQTTCASLFFMHHDGLRSLVGAPATLCAWFAESRNYATRAREGWKSSNGSLHMWSVRLDNSAACSASIGIAHADISYTDARKNIDKRYQVCCGTGEKVAINSDSGKRYLPPAMVGDILTVRLNRATSCLSFGLNGSFPLEPAYCNVQCYGMTWFPYLACMEKGAVITLIN